MAGAARLQPQAPRRPFLLRLDGADCQSWIARGHMRRSVKILVPVLAVVSTEAMAHEWYTGKKDPVTGFDCCAGSECAPIPESQVREMPGGYIYLPTGEFIPLRRVQHSHDWQYHRCIYHSEFLNLDQGRFRKGDTRCFFAPHIEIGAAY